MAAMNLSVLVVAHNNSSATTLLYHIRSYHLTWWYLPSESKKNKLESAEYGWNPTNYTIFQF